MALLATFSITYRQEGAEGAVPKIISGSQINAERNLNIRIQ